MTRIAYDHAALRSVLPEPSEIAPLAPSVEESAPEAVRLSPFSSPAPSGSPFHAPPPRTPSASALLGALERHAREALASSRAARDALLAAIAMTQKMAELEELGARVVTEQRSWLRA